MIIIAHDNSSEEQKAVSGFASGRSDRAGWQRDRASETERRSEEKERNKWSFHTRVLVGWQSSKKKQRQGSGGKVISDGEYAQRSGSYWCSRQSERYIRGQVMQ